MTSYERLVCHQLFGQFAKSFVSDRQLTTLITATFVTACCRIVKQIPDSKLCFCASNLKTVFTL